MTSDKGIGDHCAAVIAIDGPAGSGKTTTAREVARRLGFAYFDTGAMYRAIALKAVRSGCDLNDSSEIGEIALSALIDITFKEDTQRTFLDGEDVTDFLRSKKVTQAVSPVCEVEQVRDLMVAQQRQLGRDGRVVVEGRDIGTVVFPDADVKIYLTADLQERGRRRQSDMKQSGEDAGIQDVMTSIDHRDQRDKCRDNSPLMIAEDALLIDTTDLDFEEQVEIIINELKSKCV
ncbi:cytidylate kinase [candidate division LCP-89 bacterium B3_LCP]|uniref:Cytidylate kinase n=1 Tax=candidate division LCP-89 bacterium B3_LCP TaxID=2012998 RepID=A0A532UZD2_UNCL8|nr:MAG: cytidylate kinase [candidate division LCP-89 bacterium B3_LCP]